MARTGRDYIGPYRLLRLIRAGQTCQVWEAIRDTDSQRRVLKALREAYCKDREEISHLKHEFEVAKDLRHPHIVRIYEFDIARGVPYLAMELLNAQNLKQRLRTEWENRQAQLPQIVREAAEAISHLHEHGWIHCDIKPDNLLVDNDANVKLIDFAIAQRIAKGWGRWFARRPPIRGTRSYMSPEQIRGESIDPRADIYSFGCVMYEIFSGRMPFTGANADDLLQRHLRAPVPILMAANPRVSAELSDLVSRMMSKSREQRPASMEDFLAEFNQMRSCWKN